MKIPRCLLYGLATLTLSLVSSLVAQEYSAISDGIPVYEYNVGPLLERTLEHSAENNISPSQLLVNCCHDIKNGVVDTLPIDTMLALLPEIVSYAQELAKRGGPYPDGQLSTVADSLYGSACDVMHVISLLRAIRFRIGDVFQDPSELTVLGTLGNPLELGPGLNIVRKLLKIQDEFQQTWTILANLTCTATVDLSGVFTAIANINCVSTTTVDLSSVFTALNACCNSTFTSLTDIKKYVNKLLH
jgi:hypothetical protein